MDTDHPKAATEHPVRPINPRSFGLVKAAYTVNATLDVLSIGRTSLYAAVKQGDLHPVKFGRKTLFYAADLAAPFSKTQKRQSARWNGQKGRSTVNPAEPLITQVLKPGYLGLTERSIEVDWNSVVVHGPSVIVEKHSPAWKAGLRFGDSITSINGVSYDAFCSALPPAGTPFRIVAWRDGLGTFTVLGQLGARPRRLSEPLSPRFRLVPSGKPVSRQERPHFVLGFISRHPRLEARDTQLLSLLLDHEGPKGIIPKRQTLAWILRCSLSSLDRSIRRCVCEGVLQIKSGKSQRRSNKYFVTWPLSHSKSQNWTG